MKKLEGFCEIPLVSDLVVCVIIALLVWFFGLFWSVLILCNRRRVVDNDHYAE